MDLSSPVQINTSLTVLKANRRQGDFSVLKNTLGILDEMPPFVGCTWMVSAMLVNFISLTRKPRNIHFY